MGGACCSERGKKSSPVGGADSNKATDNRVSSNQDAKALSSNKDEKLPESAAKENASTNANGFGPDVVCVVSHTDTEQSGYSSHSEISNENPWQNCGSPLVNTSSQTQAQSCATKISMTFADNEIASLPGAAIKEASEMARLAGDLGGKGTDEVFSHHAQDGGTGASVNPPAESIAAAGTQPVYREAGQLDIEKSANPNAPNAEDPASMSHQSDMEKSATRIQSVYRGHAARADSTGPSKVSDSAVEDGGNSNAPNTEDPVSMSHQSDMEKSAAGPSKVSDSAVENGGNSNAPNTEDPVSMSHQSDMEKSATVPSKVSDSAVENGRNSNPQILKIRAASTGPSKVSDSAVENGGNSNVPNAEDSGSVSHEFDVIKTASRILQSVYSGHATRAGAGPV